MFEKMLGGGLGSVEEHYGAEAQLVHKGYAVAS